MNWKSNATRGDGGLAPVNNATNLEILATQCYVSEYVIEHKNGQESEKNLKFALCSQFYKSNI